MILPSRDNYLLEIKSSLFLWTYPNKIFSAWTEVWTGPCPSRASIRASGGRDLDDF